MYHWPWWRSTIWAMTETQTKQKMLTPQDLEDGLGDRMRKARKRSGVEQSVIAETIGVSPATISHWERGRGRPRLSDYKEIARLLRVPYEWLLTGQYPEAEKYSPRDSNPEPVDYILRPVFVGAKILHFPAIGKDKRSEILSHENHTDPPPDLVA